MVHRNMVQLTDSHWAVEVPESWQTAGLHFQPSRGNMPNDRQRYNELIIWYTSCSSKRCSTGEKLSIKLPITGSWQYLFTTKEATEADLKVFDHILQHHNFKEWFLDFTHRGTYFINRIGSFVTWLISKGLSSDRNYAIIQNNTNNETE